MLARDRTSIDHFYKTQWAFLSPFFESLGSTVKHYNLTVNHILPIIEDMGSINTVLYEVAQEDPSHVREINSGVKIPHQISSEPL